MPNDNKHTTANETNGVASPVFATVVLSVCELFSVVVTDVFFTLVLPTFDLPASLEFLFPSPNSTTEGLLPSLALLFSEPLGLLLGLFGLLFIGLLGSTFPGLLGWLFDGALGSTLPDSDLFFSYKAVIVISSVTFEKSLSHTLNVYPSLAGGAGAVADFSYSTVEDAISLFSQSTNVTLYVFASHFALRVISPSERR